MGGVDVLAVYALLAGAWDAELLRTTTVTSNEYPI